MKTLLMIICVVALAGCSSMPNVEDKAIFLNGYNSIQRITPYDELTKSPNILSIFSNGMYNSIPKDMDYFNATTSRSTSIWNSSAKTSTTTIIASGKGVKLAEKYIQSLKRRPDG